MIGRLLQEGRNRWYGDQGPSKQQAPLESVTEEAHTRDLLFPDVNSLRTTLQQELSMQASRPATARDAINYDDRGSLELSYPADVRIIIAQDANSCHAQPQILYDSKPYKGPDSRSGSPLNEQEPSGRQSLASRGKSMTSPTKRGHTPSNSMFSSSQIMPMSPTSPRSPENRRSFFGDSRSRASPFDLGGMENETAQGKLAREAKEETEALLGCMFGAPGFRLEPSTKLHVVPKKSPDGAKSPAVHNRPISSGGFNRRRTPLVRSTSAADVQGWSPSATSDSSDPRTPNSKPSVMVTRLFSINLPESGTTEQEEESQNVALAPPSNLTESFAAQKSGQQKNVKQKKVPVYAIAVILQLPPDGNARLRPSPSQAGLSSLGSSLNDSTPANSWRAEQSAFSSFMEIRTQTSFDSVLNPHIAQVAHHWNVLSRSIEILEIFAKSKLTVLLEQCAPPAISAPPQPRAGLAKAKKPKPQSQQSVYVLPECFQNDMQMKKSTDTAAQTIISGLRTRRVVVGQGRWGAWREEARWVGKWAGNREQNFFFYIFLTAFLGSHTAWLDSLGPAYYRRRHATQQKIHAKDSSRITHRTVIVSSDKMAARRLIFLLAAFFPSNFNHAQPLIPQLSSSYNNQYSASPPVSTLRDHSLRRSATAQRTGSSRRHQSGHTRSVSFSLMDPNHDHDSAIQDTPEPIGRRDSDNKSLKSPGLAMAKRGAESRKASLSTVTADNAEAVPHFSTMTIGNPRSPGAEKRRGSSGSMASTALTQNLKRSESSNLSTSASGRWGSVVSGFWSNRRDSTDDSDFVPSSQDSPTRRRPEHRSSVGGLERMVEEANQVPGRPSPHSTSRPLQLEGCLKPRHPGHGEGASLARSIPRIPKPERLPLKLSFNDNEGYIDVAMPATQSFNSSLASSFASIRLPNHSMADSHEHYSPYGSVASDSPHPRSEPNIDVAGWLKAYHPDFTMQAVKPYDSLVSDIKTSMYAEAQLIAHNGPDQAEGQSPSGWTDVCSTLLADTSTFTVSRLRLWRRPRNAVSTPTPSTPTLQAPTTHLTSAFTGDFVRPPSPRFADSSYETEIVTEKVMDLDPILIDAVERVVARSGPSSRATSRGPSQGPSRAASRPGSPPRSPKVDRAESVRSVRSVRTTATRRGNDLALSGEGLGAIGQAQLEVPSGECKRMVLGALEEVVRSVVEERDGEQKVKKGIQLEGGSSAGGSQDGSTQGAKSKKGSVRGRTKTRELDSTLREGVRRWLSGVEEGW